MNTTRTFRTFALRGIMGAALTAATAFGISTEELKALRAKAEAGNGIAQYNLGLHYATVSESTADPVEAYVWLNLAADNGATGRALVLLSSQLDQEQVREGKRRLEERRQEIAARRAAAVEGPVAAASPIAQSSTNPIANTPQSPIGEATPAGPDVATLQAELQKMSAELTEVWKENDQLKASLAEAKAAPASTSGANAAREQQLTEDLGKARAALMNLEGERNALQEKLAQTEKANRDAFNGELESANTRLKAAETELAQAVATIEELRKARETIAGLELKLKSSSDENERLNRSLSAANQSLDQTKQSLSQVTAAAGNQSTLEKQNQELRAQISGLKSQLETATQQVSANGEAQKQLEEAQIKLESALRSFDLQSQEVQKLQSALANIDNERETLANQLTELRNAPPKIDPAAEAKVAELTRDLESARSAASNSQEAQRQIADLQTRLRGAEANLTRSIEEKDQLFKQLNLARANSVSAEDLKRTSTELKDARERLAASEQALARAREERQQSIQEATRKSEAQITQLTADLERSRRAAEQAQQTLAEASRERDQLREQLASAAAQPAAPAPAAVSDSSAQIQELEEALARANQEKLELTQKLAAAPATASAAADIAATPAPEGTTVAEDSADLRRQLDESQGKLDAALRTYRLQQEEIDRLQAALTNIDGEREQLATRLSEANTRASEATTQATASQETAVQLAGVHEQLRQAQNQIASLANENLQLKNRLSLGAPSSATAQSTVAATAPNVSFSAPTRPSSSSAGNQSVLSRPTQPSPTPAAASPRTHTVAAGDTLSKISRRYYGTSERWSEILEANRETVRDARNLSVGMTLRIP